MRKIEKVKEPKKNEAGTEMKNKSDFKTIRAERETGETQWQQTHFRRNSSIAVRFK